MIRTPRRNACAGTRHWPARTLIALILWAGLAGALVPAGAAPAVEPAARGYFEVARTLLARGDGDRGLPLLAAATLAGPESRAAQVYLLGLLNQTCFEWRVADLEGVRTLLADDPAFLECLGRQYEGKGRYAEAEAAFLHWAEAHPELSEPHARLGELYVTAGRSEEALTAFARYREHNPRTVYAVRRMAAVAARQIEALRPRPQVPADSAAAPTSHRLTAGPDPEAQFGLAVRYQHGLGVPVDATLATEAYARAARAGHRSAQLRLALLLQDGHGVAPEPEEAARWLARAAEGGLAPAQLYLALAYLTGNGVPLDLPQAVAWSERAAAGGLPEAQFLLGTLYRYGIGTARDPEAATEWLMKAGSSLLEAGRWQAGRRAVTASFDTEGDHRSSTTARLTAVGDDRSRARGTKP